MKIEAWKTELRSAGIRRRPLARAFGRAATFALVSAMAGFAPAHADDQDVIDYRTHIMKTMGQQVAIIGMILEQRAPADEFATHVQVLAVTAATAKKAFEPEVPGGDAKPDVWAQWPDFAERLDTLAAATAELASIAKDGGLEAAAPKLKAALTCKGCHDEYRVPDEP
jgi:cytochrome c556